MSLLNLSLIFFLLLLVLNYREHRSVLFPPFIFCAMWLLCLVVIRSNLIDLDPIHGNTLAIVAAGATAFSVGGWIAGLVPRKLLRIHLFAPKPERTPDLLRNTLMIALLCGLPAMFYQTLQLSNSQGGGFNILMQARLAMFENAQSGKLSVPFWVNDYLRIVIFASLLFFTEKKDRQFWAVTVVAFIACILSTGRGDLVILIAGLSTISLLQRKQESFLVAMRILRWPIVLVSALWIGLIFTNKDTKGMTGGAAGIAATFVLSYIAGPLAAFDSVVQSPAGFMSISSHTFQFPLHLAATLHLTDYTMPPVLDSFVFVPFSMNVYTIFKFYFLELGITGTLVFLLFLGLLHSLIYLKARQGGRLSMYLFALSINTVLVVIAGDLYSDLGSFVAALGFGLLYFLIGSLPLRLFPANKQGHLNLRTSKACYASSLNHKEIDLG
jgi:oligosaccharide repeat unit polymerase